MTYTKDSSKDGYINMSPDYPGVIVPIDMSQSGKIIALRDSFLCAQRVFESRPQMSGLGSTPPTLLVSFVAVVSISLSKVSKIKSGHL